MFSHEINMKKRKFADAALISNDIKKMSFADRDEANYILKSTFENDITTIIVVEDGHTKKGDLGYIAEIVRIGRSDFTCHVFGSFKISSFSRDSKCFGDVEGIFLIP